MIVILFLGTLIYVRDQFIRAYDFARFDYLAAKKMNVHVHRS